MGCPAPQLLCEDRTLPKARHASLCLIYSLLPASICREKPSGVKGGGCPDRAAWIWSTPGCEGSRAGIGEPSIASPLRPPAWAPPPHCLLLPQRRSRSCSQSVADGPAPKENCLCSPARAAAFDLLISYPSYANALPLSASREAGGRCHAGHQMGANAEPWHAGVAADSCPELPASPRSPG